MAPFIKSYYRQCKSIVIVNDRLHFVDVSTVPVAPNALQQSILTPKVHMLGETGAVIAYIRLIQFVTK